MVVLNISDVEELNKSNELIVVHFSADWSDECKNIDKILEVLSSQPEFNGITFKKCISENFPEISLKYNISAVPTVLFLKNGNKIDEVIGADPILLNDKLKNFIQNNIKNYSSLNDLSTISNIINSEIVVACIKDENVLEEQSIKEELISILRNCNVKYRICNVLTDTSIKEGLEKFSGNKIFPQVYVNGEFVGNFETLKKLNETKVLSSWIAAAQKNMNADLIRKLISLINKNNIMVFMKGDKNFPRCGFSRQLMDILNETRIPFETFDILLDEDVRQGLKIFSDWPTYPQVYVKGELIGGLDIIKSLKDDGELIKTLQQGII